MTTPTANRADQTADPLTRLRLGAIKAGDVAGLSDRHLEHAVEWAKGGCPHKWEATAEDNPDEWDPATHYRCAYCDKTHSTSTKRPEPCACYTTDPAACDSLLEWVAANGMVDEFIREILPTNNSLWKNEPMPKCGPSQVIDWCLLRPPKRIVCQAFLRMRINREYDQRRSKEIFEERGW